MIISDEKVKEILDKVDIVSIIGEHIKLEKKGNDYKGVCPFHDDSNPSLSVSPSKKVFKCFSCGEAGNAITFVQKFRHITFPQAVQFVGERCGVEIKLDRSDSQQKNEKYYKIMQDATDFYEFYLKNTKEGKNALDYLHNRNLNDAIIKRFRIGLSSSDDNLLYQTFVKKEPPYLPVDLIKCGLIYPKKNGGYFDCFRNRIMFPLEDNYGNLVGFSGRIYHETNTDESKYLNTSENDIFKKGNFLYNYYRATNDIKKKNRIFIFEGFMDVIAAYRANVYNAVAVMGTALTENNVRNIRKLTDRIVLCFDGDGPGINATKKAIATFIKQDVEVKVLLLPEKMDPDEYANKYGEKALHDYLENEPINSFDYLYALEKRQLNIHDINSVETFKKNVFKYIKMYNSKSLETQILKRISEDLSFDDKVIINDFINSHEDVVEFEAPKGKTVKISKQKYLLSETTLLYIASLKKEYCDRIARLLPINNNTYVNIKNRNIFWAMYDYYRVNANFDYNYFYNSEFLTDELRKHLDTFFTKIVPFDEAYIEPLIEECVAMVNKYNDEKKLESLINDAQRNEEKLRSITELKKKTIKIKEKE